MTNPSPMTPAPSAGWRRARSVTVGIVATFLAVLMSVLGQVSRAEASSCSGPLAAGEIRVVLVVDAIDLGGGSSATCLVVPAGTTGSQLLARRGAELGTGSPRYGSSGLLCAIDGQPTSGCGDRNAGGFAYWAYFAGSSGSWLYGSINPFTRRLSDGDIEGWRYVQGAGNGQDPPPRIGPSRSLFPALTAAPAAPAEPAASPAVDGSAPASRGASSSAPGTVVPSDSGVGADVSTPEPVVGAAVTTTLADGPEDVAELTLAASTTGSPASGRWIGVALVAMLIALFGGGAVVRTRRSR